MHWTLRVAFQKPLNRDTALAPQLFHTHAPLCAFHTPLFPNAMLWVTWSPISTIPSWRPTCTSWQPRAHSQMITLPLHTPPSPWFQLLRSPQPWSHQIVSLQLYQGSWGSCSWQPSVSSASLAQTFFPLSTSQIPSGTACCHGHSYPTPATHRAVFCSGVANSTSAEDRTSSWPGPRIASQAPL